MSHDLMSHDLMSHARGHRKPVKCCAKPAAVTDFPYVVEAGRALRRAPAIPEA
jgi:hypothetical protein